MTSLSMRGRLLKGEPRLAKTWAGVWARDYTLTSIPTLQGAPELAELFRVRRDR